MALYVKTGQYTGNGSGTITTDLPFAPKVVFIWGPTQGSIPTFVSRIKIDTMGANNSNQWGGTTNFTDGNLTFSGNSFVSSGISGGSGNGLNISDKEYYYLVLGGTGCVTGSYTGDGTDNRAITGLGIDPDFVVVKGNLQTWGKTTATGKTTDSSFVFSAISVNSSDFIQQLLTDGFEVGSNNAVNQNTVEFYYFAIEKGNAFDEGTYTGDGVDDRQITGLAFTPSFVLVKRDTAVVPRIRSVETTDTSSSTTVNTASNNIQNIVTNGFELGTSGQVNENTGVYYWIAFKNNEPNTGNFLAFM
jgi:hypothetical protein